MIWDRFHYLCRKYNQLLRSGEIFREAVVKAGSSKGVRLYGEPLEPDSISFKLINSMKAINDDQKIEKITEMYGQLDFSIILDEPPKLRKATAYITLLFIIYFMISGVYQIYVTPTFISLVDSYEFIPPDYMGWYLKYWYLPALIVLSLMGILFAFSYQV